jgi:hypothetical protein
VAGMAQSEGLKNDDSFCIASVFMVKTGNIFTSGGFDAIPINLI